jgi:hypothetical protein
MARSLMCRVHRLQADGVKEAERLEVVWVNGRLTLTYTRLGDPLDEGEFYAETWEVECPKPLVTKRRHRSGNLVQEIDDLEER